MKPSSIISPDYEIVQELRSPNRYIAGAFLGALIFLGSGGIGTWFYRQGLEMIESWHSAQNWVSTTAIITEARITERIDKERVTGNYLDVNYMWTLPGCPSPDAAKPVWNQQLGLNCSAYQSNALNLGSKSVYRRGTSTKGWLLYEQMEAARISGNPWPIFMNPDNPSQAVIDRSMPVKNVSRDMLSGTLFAAAGFSWGLFVIFSVTDRSLRKLLLRRFPEKPWLHDEGWITGRIRGTSARKVLYCFLAGIPFLLIPAPALVHDILHGSNTPGGKLGLISLLPIVGIGCVAVGAILYLRWKRFDNAWLEIFKHPIKTGDTLRGRIHLPPIFLKSPLDVKLIFDCEERWTEGSGKHKKTYTNKHYEYKRVLKIDGIGLQGFAIEHNIPSSMPGTIILGMGHLAKNHQITWTLKVYAAIDGPNLDLCFKLPIFDSY